MEENVARRLRTLDDVAVDGKSVLLRVDFNVPVGDDGVVDHLEDYRIQAALDTIDELRQRRCKIVLLTHRGRPGEEEGDFDLEPIRRRLEELARSEVRQISKINEGMLESVLSGLEAGGVVLLPNVRLDDREMTGGKKFAEELANLADVYVNEAFSVCHRDHASVAEVPKLMTSCAGRRTVLEYEVLERLSSSPEHSYVAIASGSKVHTKVSLLRRLLEKADHLCVGGRIANAFLVARGLCSNLQCDEIDVGGAGKIWEEFEGKIMLPVDVVVRDKEDGEIKIVPVNEIPETADGVWDVGPETVKNFLKLCAEAKTVVWNGPLGKIEEKDFKEGTEAFARGLAEGGAYRVVGGGDTVSMLERCKVMSKFDHVSVGGGAMIAMLEGKKMPGLEPLFK